MYLLNSVKAAGAPRQRFHWVHRPASASTSSLGLAILRRASLLMALAFVCASETPLAQAQFDHTHVVWNALLAKHVVLVEDAKASRVRYTGLARDRATLQGYLAALSAVAAGDYAGWTKAQQMAFLINAYNAYTVEKILTRYPELKSIRDFGRVIGNPWKDPFFRLLGQDETLDGIEHGRLRAKGAFDEPRVHFALNCAAIGCPMLREEAYVAPRLEAQLEEQARRFLADRNRNRYNAERKLLQVSRIFDWYREDWRGSPPGSASLEQFFARYALVLSDDPAQQKLIMARQAEIGFLEYDWLLNDAGR